MFVELTRGHWTPDPPDTDEAVNALIAIAARHVDEAAMLIPVLACLLRFLNSFRMVRRPDFKPSAAAEGQLGA